MRYIQISNKGNVIPSDLILLGSSTKRDDASKIGQFGSGTKFALSWLMRNGCQPFIFSGKEEIILETTMVEHRGHVREVIMVNGERSSITTEFGMMWKGWMALREFYSNAIDEGEESFDTIEIGGNVEGYQKDFITRNFLEEGRTNIFIPMNEELEHVVANFSDHFAFERIPDWVGVKGALYIKSKNSDVMAYRKGIKCFNYCYQTMVDFNFNNVPITEDRLIDGGSSTFDDHASFLLQDCDDIDVVKAAIKSDYRDIHPMYPTDTYILAYKELLAEGMKFTSNSMQKIMGMMASGMIIPSNHYKKLIDMKLIDNPMEAIFQHLDFAFQRVAGNEREVEAILNKYTPCKVYYGKMDTFYDVKAKQVGKGEDAHVEFYMKEHLAEKNPAEMAARCLKEHPNYTQIVSELL